MNRSVSGKLALNVRVLRRNFCSTADTKLSGGQPATETCSQQYDIAIVGGGMVGMALASSLANTPLTKHLNVAIIDSNPALGRRPCIRKEDTPDPRVSTVNPASISFFKDIGAWKYVEKHRHAYFDKMQVWDYTGLGYTRYSARDVNKDVLGCVVENKVLLSSLLSCMQDTDPQKKIYASRLSSMAILPNSSSFVGTDSRLSSPEALFTHGRLAKLELCDGNSLYAKLVVGADGGKSRVRELSGIRTTGWSYSQNALICTVEHSVENRCAWQRFLRAGPIALLPISDKFSNIVWTMNPKESSEFKSMCEDEFLKAVNHALEGNADFSTPPKAVELASGSRMVFPLSLLHANDYAARRVVLVGDAAHTVHPLAGQGVNMGFGDASALSRFISESVAVGTDIGEVSLLKKYEFERKAANVAMMAVVDGFQKAYSVDFGPVNILRAAAFHAAHYISPLKKTIISFASGEQRLPLFSQGIRNFHLLHCGLSLLHFQ